jgi:hypothetical protein
MLSSNSRPIIIQSYEAVGSLRTLKVYLVRASFLVREGMRVLSAERRIDMIKKCMIIGVTLSVAAGSATAIAPELGYEIGYASRYVAEGIDSTPDAEGIFYSELTIGIEDVSLGGLFLQGNNDSYNELNLFLESGLYLGPVSVHAGVQFLTYPAGEEDADSWEVYVGFDADLMGLATIYGAYFHDFDAINGGFLVIGLSSDIPQLGEALTFSPYIQFGVDAGYVSGPRRLAENNLQVGVNAAWSLMDHVELVGGAHHSFALTNLNREGEGDVSWAQVGISLSF